MAAKKRKKRSKTTEATAILHKTFIKGKPKRQASVETERLKFHIAEQIYRLRRRRGLTQKQLAELVGTQQSVISRLEDADYEGYTLKSLQRFAEALHCKLRCDFVPEEEQFAYA